MLSRPTVTAVAVALLFMGLPGRAQYAFNAPVLERNAPSGVDPEESPKASGYKTVHGVVQGRAGVLPGATVWLHGSRTIVVTNAEGEFELRVPADAKIVELTCGFAGLQDEIVRLPPVQALGSLYMLRPHNLPTK
jgi:hypothetical protein